MKRYPRIILGTVCIPWNEDFSLDEELFREEIRFLTRNDLRTLYIFGTAGEGYAANDSMFETVTRVFVEEMKECSATPMVGIITPSLKTAIERIEQAAAMGVRQFQISLPSWGVLNGQELLSFFKETCGRFPELQFLHYNLMRSGRLVTPAEYGIIASEHENLVATKNGTRDTMLIQSLLEKAPQLRHFFTEPSFAYGSLMGECGFLISIASINPALAREYFNAGASGDVARLIPLQKELQAMTEHLLSVVGNEAHMDGAYDKIFCKFHRADFPLRLLPPYNGVSDETFARFADILRRDFAHWIPAS